MKRKQDDGNIGSSKNRGEKRTNDGQTETVSDEHETYATVVSKTQSNPLITHAERDVTLVQLNVVELLSRTSWLNITVLKEVKR